MALINGIEYSWSDIKLSLLGRTVEGITAITYGDKRDKMNNHGKGSKAVSRARGKYEAEAKITLSMKEVEAIQAALPRGKKLQDIPMFNIDIAYVPEDGSSKIIKDRILNAEFTNKKRETKTGEGEILHELELIISEVDWNV